MPHHQPGQGSSPHRNEPAAAHDPRALTQAFARATASGGQMTPAQYFRIALEVLRRAPCRLLVVGAGRDTELYCRANAGGRTVVLEHQLEWAEAVRGLGCTVVPVAYRTRLADGLLADCAPPDGLPEWLLRENWDVILVDGPEGFRPEHPGRQQSIFLAAKLARPGTIVFLHDADRPAERQSASRYLKPPDERVGARPCLAAFHYSDAEAGEPSGRPLSAPPAAPRREATGRRLLFCSYHCLVDPSSGAALSAGDLLALLAGRGWACEAICGPQLDSGAGESVEQLLSDLRVPVEVTDGAGPCPFTLFRFTHRGVPATVFRLARPGLPATPAREEGEAFLALLGRTLDRFRPDVFLTYGGHWLAAEAMKLARTRGARVVFTLRNLAYRDAAFFRNADAVHVPSHFAREHYRRTLGLECVAIPGPWDWSRVRCAEVVGRYVTFVNP